jgi:hypothetical protein
MAPILQLGADRNPESNRASDLDFAYSPYSRRREHRRFLKSRGDRSRLALCHPHSHGPGQAQLRWKDLPSAKAPSTGATKLAICPTTSAKLSGASSSRLFLRNDAHCACFSGLSANPALNAVTSEGIAVPRALNVASTAAARSSPRKSKLVERYHRSKKSFMRLLMDPSFTMAWSFSAIELSRV